MMWRRKRETVIIESIKGQPHKITIKYVINRQLHGFCNIITRISPQKTSISASQAPGDIGFLWADSGDDMEKNMKYYITIQGINRLNRPLRYPPINLNDINNNN